MLVAPGGEEQAAVFDISRNPLADRKRFPGIRQDLHRPEVRGEHGAHAERRFRVLRIDDGLRDGPFHGFGERLEVRFEQVLDQHPVVPLALFPQHARAVGEQLPRSRDPERVHGVLLLRNERRGHGVEVPGRPGLEERRPARGARIQRIEQNVPLRIEKRLRITPHLVVDHAAVASLSDLPHEIGNQDRLAGACRAGHDRVLGLGPLGVGDACDTVRARFSRNRPPRPSPQRAHAPAQLPCAHQFRPAKALLLFQPMTLVSEPAEHEGDQARADFRAEPRA